MANPDKLSGAVIYSEVTLTRDEGNRPYTTIEGLGSLNPVLGEGSVITAGNASQLSDGASASVLMERELAEARGLSPLGRICRHGCRGDEAGRDGIRPVYAVPKLLERFGLGIEDIGL
jgi:acetyl-CoA acetyltransferase